MLHTNCAARNDGFCSDIRMKVKKIKLFGFEVDPYANGEKCSRESEGERSIRSSDEVLWEREKTVHKKSSICGPENKNESEFCFKEFSKSQASRGRHQNGRKMKRLKKKMMQLQAKSASFDSYLRPLQNDGSFVSHPSSPWLIDFSYVTEDEESRITFNSLDQNQNFQIGASHHVIKPTALAPHRRFEQETCGRPVVIKPLPSYISKENCHSLYIQLGLAQQPDI